MIAHRDLLVSRAVYWDATFVPNWNSRTVSERWLDAAFHSNSRQKSWPQHKVEHFTNLHRVPRARRRR